jgi:hypothetical protein
MQASSSDVMLRRAFLHPRSLFSLLAAPPATCAVPSANQPERFGTIGIILHTTEAGLRSSRYSVIAGRNTNYLLASDGTLETIVPERLFADHAGQSMWGARTDLSWQTIGIEIVGYHTSALTHAQYDTLEPLIRKLQETYSIPDEFVLAHYQVAYNEPDGVPQRGRKLDGSNIDWGRLGIKHTRDDPDVRAGRMQLGPVIEAIYAAEAAGKSFPLVAHVPRRFLPRKPLAALDAQSKNYKGRRVGGD